MVSTPLTNSIDSTKPRIAARFLRAAQLTTGAGLIARFLQALLPFLIARLISRADFGIYTIVVSTVTLGELGQTATLQKFLPQFAVRQSQHVAAFVDTVFAISLACLLALASILFLSSHLIAIHLYSDASLTNYLRIAAILLASFGLFNVFSGALAGLQAFGKFSVMQLLRSGILLVLGVSGAIAFGLPGALTAQVIGSVIVIFLAGRFASNALLGAFGSRLSLRTDRRFLGMITGFSVPMFLSAALVLPAYWLAIARLSRLFGVREVAQFGIAFGVMQIVTLIPNVTSMTALSFLSESHARSDNSFGSLSNLNLRVAWGLALITAVFLSFAAPQFLHLVYGSKYGDFHSLLLFMMMAGLVMSICGSLGSVIAGTGRMWQALGLNATWLAFFTFFVTVLVPRLASRGLALSYFCAYALFALLACLYCRYVCGMSLNKIPSLVAVSGLGFALVELTLDKAPSFSLAIGCLTTVLIAFLCWALAMTDSERIAARARFRGLAERRSVRSASARRKERILYLCHVDWGWMKQRPQHLAEHLGQYFDVTIAFNYTWRRGSMVNHFHIGPSCIPLLRVPKRDHFPHLKGLDDFAMRISLRLLIWLVRPAYIWLTSPDLYTYLPRHVRSSIIYDCMDDAPAFPRELKRAAALARVEHELVSHAQLVFVSSERLRDTLQSRHGAQTPFHLLRNAFGGKSLALPSQSHPFRSAVQIGYCGTIASWLDWDLLLNVLDSFPGMEFHLVGAIDAGASIVPHDRIIWHGPKKHDELLAIMSQFDCLAMPFQVTPLIESVDPVKLYEYISFGRPILAVYYDEIARFAPFVHFYRSHKEALELVSRLAVGGLDRKYSEPERETFLVANSWSERASAAATLLKSSRARS